MISFSYQSLFGEIEPEAYYELVVFLAYKQLQFISYTVYFVDHHNELSIKHWAIRFYDMLWYSLYMPYSISLIVLYPEFQRQMKQRDLRKINVGEIATLSIRFVSVRM